MGFDNLVKKVFKGEVLGVCEASKSWRGGEHERKWGIYRCGKLWHKVLCLLS